MTKVLSTLILALFAVLAAGIMAGLAPEPDPIPRRWQLDLSTGPLRVATVDVEGVGTRKFYYLTYKVTNNTGQDLLFAPAFELVTDSGEIRRAGRDVPAAVTREIMSRLENPFLEDQIAIVGTLLQGPENAKEGLAVWWVEDIKPGDISIFASGFSGETRAVEFPNPETGEQDRVLLRKTLMLRYVPPGEIRDMGSQPIQLGERRWILR